MKNLNINNYEVCIEKKNNVFHVSFADINCELQIWNWGAKNTAIDLSTRYHAPSQSYYTDTVIFNEQMMRAYLGKIDQNGKEITFLDVDANIGDTLLDICVALTEESDLSLSIPQKWNVEREKEHYRVETTNVHFELKKWTFGEKMDVVKKCSVYDPNIDDIRLLNGMFAEEILTVCGTYLKIEDEEISLTSKNIKSLPVSWGDFLSDITIDINGSQESQKKT